MKVLKYIVLLFAIVLIVPFIAFAEGEEEAEPVAAEEDNRAIIYFFHGSTCSHCAEAKAWFESIQGEYGSKFRIAAYEVWNDAENAALMQKVSDLRNDNATGVPYIICGDQSWIGFNQETMGPEILSKIDEVYNTPVAERYDVMSLLPEETEEPESTGNDVVALIIILVVVGAIGFGIYKARKANES